MKENKYKGKCYTCGAFVPARAGGIDKRAGKWRAFCPTHSGNATAPTQWAYTPDESCELAKDRISSWCSSSDSPEHTGMREGDYERSQGRPYTVRNVAAWGDDRNPDGTDKATIVYARGSCWDEVEDALRARFPVLTFEQMDAKAGSTYTRFAGGAEVFTNRNGRCEDAPCCGCCS